MFNLMKTVLLFTLMLFLLTACGKGEAPAGASTATVSGVASKGPIKNGNVTVTNLSGKVLATGTTSSDGSYSIDLFGYKGPIIVKITGGEYVDEATGGTVLVANTMPNGLRAAFGNASGATRMIVTPLTEIAVQKAVNAGLSASSITTANSAVSTAFNINNIITTNPATPAGVPSLTQTDGEKYVNALVNISKIAKNNALDLAQVIDTYFPPASINSNGTWAAGDFPQVYKDAVLEKRLTLWPNKPSAINAGDSITLFASGGDSGVTPVTFTVDSGQATLNNGLGQTGATVTKTTADVSLMGITTPLALVSVAGTGNATIKASFVGGTTAFTTVSFVDQTGVTDVSVSLTQAGIDLVKNQNVKSMKFNLVNSNGSVISLLQKVTDNVNFDFVEQSGAATTQVVLSSVGGVPVNAATQPMLVLRYGYNPSAPVFAVSVVGDVTFADNTTVTLAPSHFLIN
jgi:hypothetical protein